MSARPEHCKTHQVSPIPHTINAIGAALMGERRARFYGEVLAAEQGDELDAVMTRWWTDAMLSQDRHRSQGRADALAGRRLVALTELASR